MTQARPRSRTRAVLGIIGVFLLVLLGAGVGASWRLEKRVWAVGTELIAGARELHEARWPRPSHVDDPTPGTFGQALTPLMPELRRFHLSEPKLPSEVLERCRDVERGRRPLSELPQDCRDALERGRSLMERALAASHAVEGGQPDGLQFYAAPDHPYYENRMPLLRVFHFAALQMRLLTDRGQADLAVETCLDTLALARDVSHGGGLLGAVVSWAGSSVSFSSCSAALQGASPASLPHAERALRRIREGLSPFSMTLRQESLQYALSIVGSVMDPEQVKQLPDAVRGVVARELPSEYELGIPLIKRILARDTLVQIFRYDQRLISVVDLPPSLRKPPMAELARQLQHSWNPILHRNTPSFTSFAKHADQQRAMLDLLLALAWVREYRAAHGEWPSDLPPLHPERAVLLPTPLRLQRGQADTLTLLPDEPTLRELTAEMDPKELAQHPFEVTVGP